MKAILVVLDGLADNPVQGKTPLDSAVKPSLDFLAKNGECGVLDVLGGKAPESDSAVLSILGYDPYKYYTGRGPLEAVGIGVKVKQGMLALRCNFATTSNGKDLVDRRVKRSLSSSESKKLAAAVEKGVKLPGFSVAFKASVAHRAVLLIKGKRKLSAKITNTDPAYSISSDGVPHALAKFDMRVLQSAPLDKEASDAAALLNEFTRQSYEILRKHPVNKAREKKGLLPANIIISRDAGDRLPPLYRLGDRYKKRFAIMADMPLEVGIGTVSGMKVNRLPVPTFTKADFAVRVKKAVSALKTSDVLYVHIKGPDLFGHEGDYVGKKKCIEDIDQYFFSPLLRKVDLSKVVFAVTADHATPCAIKGHSGDPVPFVVCGGKSMPRLMSCFSERECSSGIKLKATQFMDFVLRKT